MHILVSFCNQRAPGLPGLGLLDVITSDFRVLSLPSELTQCRGVTGLAVCEQYLYVVAQSSDELKGRGTSGSSVLFILDRRDLTLCGQYAFCSGTDIHSLWSGDGVLYAVATGTDEVLELRLRGAKVVSERGFWRPDPQGPREDIHHLNAILGWRGALIVSGFGKRADRLWSSARNGFIMDISSGNILAEEIDQPHSLANLDGALGYCESRKMAIRVVGDPRAQYLAGYTRGLCAVGASVFAASSMGRQQSKSTGAINNPAAGGVLGGVCAISRLSSATFQVEHTIDLGVCAQEIYDLYPIEGACEWPVEAEISWRDTSIRELAQMVDQRTAWAKQTTEVLALREATVKDMQVRMQELVLLRCKVEEQGAQLTAMREQLDLLNRCASWAMDRWAPDLGKTLAYLKQIILTQQIVRSTLPVDATVLVVSKGDEELLKLDGRTAWHFPQTLDGVYAGTHPASSESAIAQLEALRARRADYLLLPRTAMWWLEHYTAFRDHLRRHYKEVVHQPDACVIYDLREPRASQVPAALAGLEDVVAQCRKHLGCEPAVLDWNTGLHLATVFPHLAVFSPQRPEMTLPYLDGSIDIVAIPRVPARIPEARRVAQLAVVMAASSGKEPDTPELEVEWLREGTAGLTPSVSVIMWALGPIGRTRRRLDALKCRLPSDFRGDVVVLTDELARAAVEELGRQWGNTALLLKVLPADGSAGYAASCNRAAMEASGDVLVILGDVLVPLDGWLPPLLDVLDSRPRVGAVCGKVIAADGTLDHAGGVIFSDASAAGFGGGDYQLDDPLYSYVRKVDYSSEHLLVTTRLLFQELGRFDPTYHNPTYVNADYCFRVRGLGYSVYYQPASVSVSLPCSYSNAGTLDKFPGNGESDRALFHDRWKKVLANQPSPRHWRDRDFWHALTVCGDSRAEVSR